jgi:integration host factor subunit beta
MTKSELIQSLYAQWTEMGFSAMRREELQEAVDRIFGLLADALAAGERIELRGFGAFSLHDIPARQGVSGN